ncbi:carboxypeptidase B-like [Uranotaenia lowii]|uniref:carboxypeptidase B-like n=1 Tax=Uranotaenia lowii TaxID=190385 RepID=UPI0024786342|nr:carboxypeptidase B-like [Uranotaenia lowii]
MRFGAVFLILALAILASGEQFSYRNYKVFKVQHSTREEYMVLRQWAEKIGIDFWDRHRIMVRPDVQEQFAAFLEARNFSYEIIIEDVEVTVEAERKYNEEYIRAKKLSGRSTVDFEHFWRLDEIYNYLDELEAEYPQLVNVETVGTTHEGRPIKAITISKNGGQIDGSRPVIFMDAGVHAREWAAISSTLYFIHEVVEHYYEFEDDLLERDWVIVPVGNPDGYEYSHTNQRFWRKNRVPVSILCYGVDLNRNFPFEWALITNVCSDTYGGPSAGSEPETQVIMNLLERYQSSVQLYLAVHTWGDMILYPYGYAWPFIPVDNEAEHIAMGNRAKDAVTAAGNPNYVVGNSAEILYIASGASDDYAASTGIPYAFTLELTGGGSGGFDLPPERIEEVGKQTFEIFRSMAMDL